MSILPATLKTSKLKTPKIPLFLTNPSNLNKWLSQNIKHKTQFNQILSQAIASGLFTDPLISSKLLLYSLTNTHDFSFSNTLFFQIKNPNIFAYNFMFKAYSQSSNPLKSIALYNSMLKNGVFPDNYTFPFLFKACGRLLLLYKGQELHALSLKLGLEIDVFVLNALLSMYSSCGLANVACRVFDMIPVFIRDVVSWNSMINGYIQCGCYFKALKVFESLLVDNFVKFDEVTLISVLTACARLRLVDIGKKVHALVVVNGFALDSFLGSSLIDMYAKCGQARAARKVFNRITDRNLVCWTSMIVGYALVDMFKESIVLFRYMQLSGVIADAALAASVISACGHMGALDQGRWVQTYCERNGFDMSLSVRNALIDMYSKCGDIDKAFQIFNEMSEQDVFSWTAMISGLAMNGKCDEALDLFAQMEISSDVRPNEVTFLGVLFACSHGGFVDKGFQYFKTMICTYHLTPHIEHYGCMVDLLCRANLLIEAQKFIRAMPIQADVVIWRSLLFACRNQGNVELAELAIKKIGELEPRKSEALVLLSGIYASASRWDEVSRVRKRMAHQKIQKQPGCSFVEIDGLVQEFFAEVSSDNQMDAIYETNMRLHEVLQFAEIDSEIFDHQQNRS